MAEINFPEIQEIKQDIEQIKEMFNQSGTTDHPLKLYNIEFVADLFSCSPGTIKNLVDDGSLKAVNVRRNIRFTRQDINEFIQKLRSI